MVIKKAYFLDADYIVRDNKTYVRLLVKGKKKSTLYYQRDPYFYVDAPVDKKNDLMKVHVRRKNGQSASPLRIEEVKRTIGQEEKVFLKLSCHQPSDVPIMKQAIPFKCYEYNIPFGRRFILDMQLAPFSTITYERENREIKKIIKIETKEMPKLDALAFDIEVYNPFGAPREKKDQIIMVSYSGKENGVVTYKNSGKKFIKPSKDEKGMLENFCRIVKEENPDVLFGYNSSAFDLPYLKARADFLGVNFSLGRGKGIMRKIKKGLLSGMKIPGRIHIDLYPMMRFFGFIGLIKAQEFKLGKIAEEVIGKKKFEIKLGEMWQLWDKGEIEDITEYSMTDAIITKELGENFIALEMELSNLTKMPLFDTALSTSGQLVENLLMQQSVIDNALIPSRPSDAAIKERMANPIKGAFVKLPEPGVYENIAVMDFRGLYPSIIVSYNIDPATVTKDEKNVHTAPNNVRFLKHPQGIIPKVVNWLLDYRSDIKKEIKKHDKNSAIYKQLNARSWGIKIVTNSIYGYLAYPRSRWYSRDCGDSTTAYGRKHILESMEKAEAAGFQVLYIDTDSLFVIYKNKKDVLDFIDKINKELPEKMELELEGFYPRGVFVSKKAEEKGAKKKYALIGEDGRFKIRGFELVRRDWSEIAKETQLHVLEAILKDGSKEKAVAIVRETIERLKSGKVEMKELAIETELKKDTDKYEVKSPELGAAQKAKHHGMALEKGSVISYVITKKGATISEKAELLEFAKDYDADYYINNQVLPAVMKILKELGYDEHGLKIGGKQKSLGVFFD